MPKLKINNRRFEIFKLIFTLCIWLIINFICFYIFNQRWSKHECYFISDLDIWKRLLVVEVRNIIENNSSWYTDSDTFWWNSYAEPGWSVTKFSFEFLRRKTLVKKKCFWILFQSIWISSYYVAFKFAFFILKLFLPLLYWNVYSGFQTNFNEM